MKESQTLIIPALPKSLNELFAMHHMARAKYKKEISKKVFYLIKEQKIKPVKRCILNVALVFAKQRRRDIDNFAGGLKFLLCDPLKDAGIVKDDNSDVVQAINLSFALGDKPETRIEIEET